MNIENDIFKRTYVDYHKILDYGFTKDNDNYYLERNINDSFKAIITIDNNGIINGKVIDISINEEYTNIRTNMNGEFVNNIRKLYQNLLIDIRNNCFNINFFISNQANRINQYIKVKYNNNPEFLWKKSPYDAVYRNSFNNKWYAIIMNINMSKIAIGNEQVERINVKLDRNKIKLLLHKNGYYKAYHMNKNDWITIVLNDTLKDDEIKVLIDESYNIINK